MNTDMKPTAVSPASRSHAIAGRRLVAGLGLASGCLLALPALARMFSRNRKCWERDGLGWRARIGVLTPDDDAVPESEFWTMAPEGVSVHAARVPIGDVRKYVNPPGPDDAIEHLAHLPLSSIIFAFTTTSYVLGTTGEQKLTARLEKASNGIPVLLPTVAAVAAFHAFAARRIALFHPPWFSDDIVEKGIAYFQDQGFKVVHASHMLPACAIPHPNVGSDFTPAEIYEWVRKNAPSNMDCAYIAGNGFRSIGVIEQLESDLGRPVLTANQVAFWYALRLAEVEAEVGHYGKVFRKMLPDSEPDLQAAA